MDGVLIIDKPAGITSHDVVARVRRKLATGRVGHTGTLDPFATGVMVVLVGRATRLAQFLDKDEKEYEALVQFGCETDTGDRTGRRMDGSEPGTVVTGPLLSEPGAVATGLLNVDWEKVLDSFRGEIEQVPPMYSAKKIDGTKLYEHARKGRTINRKPIRVLISKLEIDKNPVATASGSDNTLRLRVACSAGTYIRTLAEDIGRAVGTGAHLAELRRTRAGRFGLTGAISLDAFEQMETPREHLLPMAKAVDHLRVFMLDAGRAEKTKNGLSTRTEQPLLTPGEPVRMIGPDGELLAVGIFDEQENSVRPKVVLV